MKGDRGEHLQTLQETPPAPPHLSGMPGRHTSNEGTLLLTRKEQKKMKETKYT